MSNLEDNFLRACWDALPEPVAVASINDEIVFANRAFVSLVGSISKSVYEILNRSAQDIVLGDCLCTVNRSRPVGPGEQNPASDGPKVLVRAFRASSNHIIILIEPHFGAQHAERLQTLGLLASGVAHDFNNMLAGILGHIAYLRNVLPAAGNHIESLKAIEQGAKKASGVTQQILTFSRASSKATVVHFTELVKTTCMLLRGAMPSETKLEICDDPPSTWVLAEEAKLTQILVNLVINARDALNGSGYSRDGRIDVSLSSLSDQKELHRVFGTSELASNSYVCVRVRDNGSGMDSETLERIFEPYFSTKDRGTGLGLATVREIVIALGGVIEVRSEVGAGTEFSIYLPQVAAEKKGESRAKIEKGRERILVVDDESSVRNILALSLQHLGYAVQVAESGEVALGLVSGGQRFDLVILDMMMPKLSGEETFFKIKEVLPEARVLLISGYSASESVQAVLASGGLDFVQKPFTIEDLSRKVRSCLDVQTKLSNK